MVMSEKLRSGLRKAFPADKSLLQTIKANNYTADFTIEPVKNDGLAHSFEEIIEITEGMQGEITEHYYHPKKIGYNGNHDDLAVYVKYAVPKENIFDIAGVSSDSETMPEMKMIKFTDPSYAYEMEVARSPIPTINQTLVSYGPDQTSGVAQTQEYRPDKIEALLDGEEDFIAEINQVSQS